MLKKHTVLFVLFCGIILTLLWDKLRDDQKNIENENTTVHMPFVKTNKRQTVDPVLASLQEPTIGESTVEVPVTEKKSGKYDTSYNGT